MMTASSVLQSALDPAGPQAARISHLWWLMFWATTAVFVVVMAFLGWAIVRGARLRSREHEETGATQPKPTTTRERALTSAVAVAVGATVVILFVLLVASVSTGRAVGSLGASSAVSIVVTGHQWWWQVEY